MFSWSNLFNLQNCELNDSMVNWLGVEKESLSTDCTSKDRVFKSDRNPASKINKQQNLALSYKTTK